MVKELMNIKPITAYAVVKEKIYKSKHGNYKREYLINALDIFADSDVRVDKNTEKIIKVKIEPYEVVDKNKTSFY